MHKECNYNDSQEMLFYECVDFVQDCNGNESFSLRECDLLKRYKESSFPPGMQFKGKSGNVHCREQWELVGVIAMA